jgi:hypothetical protein
LRRMWVLAGLLTLATAACSSSGSSSSSDANGALPTASAPTTAAAATASPTASVSATSYVMPPFGAGVHIEMTSWLPADPDQAAAVNTDKSYALAFLYAEYKSGKDQGWMRYVTATMQRETMSALVVPDVTTESFIGTIRYSHIRVIPDPTLTGRLDVSTCFDNSKSSNISLKTGKALPDNVPADQHYILVTDQLAKSASGRWQVAATLPAVYYPQARECKP